MSTIEGRVSAAEDQTSTAKGLASAMEEHDGVSKNHAGAVEGCANFAQVWVFSTEDRTQATENQASSTKAGRVP